jgi:hypothetical protein
MVGCSQPTFFNVNKNGSIVSRFFMREMNRLQPVGLERL